MRLHTGSIEMRPSTLTIHIGALTAQVLVAPSDTASDVERKIRRATTGATLDHLTTRWSRTMELLAD